MNVAVPVKIAVSLPVSVSVTLMPTGSVSETSPTPTVSGVDESRLPSTSVTDRVAVSPVR